MKEVCKIMDTEKKVTNAHHAQMDGLVECFNDTLAEGLSMYVSIHQKDWGQHLPMILFAYWVSPNAPTCESTFSLLYACKPCLLSDVLLFMPSANLSVSISVHLAWNVQNPEDAQCIIQSNTQLAQKRMKEQYDKTAEPVPLKVALHLCLWRRIRKGKGANKENAGDMEGYC